MAYEAARQLTEKGHEVALLVLFDTLNPATRQLSARENPFEVRLQKIKFLANELRGLRPRNIEKYLLEKMHGLRYRFQRTASTVESATRIRVNAGRLENSEQIVQAAIDQYQPPPYSGRVAFFNAAARPAGSAWELSRGWQHLARELEVHEVPGDHSSMFLEPNVDTLASKVSEAFVSLRTTQFTGEPLARSHANSR